MKILTCVVFSAMVLLGLAACSGLYEEANYPEMRFDPGNQ
jgi:hypothetical protein